MSDIRKTPEEIKAEIHDLERELERKLEAHAPSCAAYLRNEYGESIAYLQTCLSRIVSQRQTA